MQGGNIITIIHIAYIVCPRYIILQTKPLCTRIVRN
jgi:hypothetical protein